MREFLATHDKLIGIQTREEEAQFAKGLLERWEENVAANVPMAMPFEIRKGDVAECYATSGDEDFRIWFGKDFYLVVKREGKKFRPILSVRSWRKSITRDAFDTIEEVESAVIGFHAWFLANAKIKSKGQA